MNSYLVLTLGKIMFLNIQCATIFFSFLEYICSVHAAWMVVTFMRHFIQIIRLKTTFCCAIICSILSDYRHTCILLLKISSETDILTNKNVCKSHYSAMVILKCSSAPLDVDHSATKVTQL